MFDARVVIKLSVCDAPRSTPRFDHQLRLLWPWQNGLRRYDRLQGCREQQRRRKAARGVLRSVRCVERQPHAWRRNSVLNWCRTRTYQRSIALLAQGERAASVRVGNSNRSSTARCVIISLYFMTEYLTN